MSFKKQLLKSKPVCKVTFRFPKGIADHAGTVAVAGDFNNWDASACEMSRSKTGEFTAMLNLEKGRTYEFRYLVDGKEWYNDPQADYYVANGYGEENGVFIAEA